MEHTLRFIQDQTSLDEWCRAQYNTISLLAVDTEFMRVKTYFPKLCLIQLATETELVCVDPLAIDDLSSLSNLLTAPNILKILHAASQDIEAIVHELDILPAPIFDTQIAINVMGEHDNLMSYQEMIDRYQGIHLEKDQARTQWDHRPLSPRQIEYAYDDVRYLINCYEILEYQITDKDLESELKNAHKVFEDRAHYEPDCENAWKKVKGYKRLRRIEKQLLMKLAKAREIMAVRRNLPKRWIIKDQELTELSKRFSSQNNTLDTDEILNKFNPDIKKILEEAITNFWNLGRDSSAPSN